MRRKRGNMAIELALFIPVMVLLIVGMVQVGKVVYLNYTLQKIIYGAGRQLAVQQGVNYCDLTSDATYQAALQFALNDPTTGTPIVANLTDLTITPECLAADGTLAACDNPDCVSLGVSQRPDYLLVTIPGGYPVNVRIPFLSPISITLDPHATVPFGGLS